MKTLVLLAAVCVAANAWYYGRPEPNAWTQGGVWPLPWTLNYDNSFNHTINPGTFRFTSTVGTCDVIDKALTRYSKLTFAGYNAATYSDSAPTLTSVAVSVTGGCDTSVPQLEMDESYQVKVDSAKAVATITANQVWGALRGLETFSQLVFEVDENKFRVRSAAIADSPRFAHRGVMIDSSRHFLPIPVILQNLDIMAINKMNVLHWHLVDSEAFPYTSNAYPNLTKYGAYSPRHIYSIADMQKVIEYARLRGIRVVPEFDTPGHTGSWGYGIPNLLSQCYNSKGQISQLPNILDPTLPQNMDFIRGFFTEALALFKDNYMHFGGDEVDYDMTQCWQNNAEVQQRMKGMGISSIYDLLDYYWNQLFQIIDVARPGTKKVVWQEVLDMNVPATESIAHVWKGDTIEEVMQEMQTVTANGHKAILSSCWYLNYIKYGADWGYVNDDTSMRTRGMYYECDPQGFAGTQAQKDLVIGGEAAMWGEFVDATNFIPRMWPRASAVAERLWSDPMQTTSADWSWPRLHEFRCRLLRKGFAAEPPNDPDYCTFEWNQPYTEL